ncbi:MAG: NAD(P)H-dependent oxidoreductase [Candidatus Micrarchaeota archaeon]
MYVPIILGTARKGRQSEKAAAFVLEQAKEHGFDSELIDVRDYHIQATDNTGTIPAAKRLAEKVKKADALIIVTPEYNHGYPGELKMALDMLYDEFDGKTLGICGVSSGPIGGARCVEQLRQVAITFRMKPTREALYFSNIKELFDESGSIKGKEAWARRVKRLLDELGGKEME